MPSVRSAVCHVVPPSAETSTRAIPRPPPLHAQPDMGTVGGSSSSVSSSPLPSAGPPSASVPEAEELLLLLLLLLLPLLLSIATGTWRLSAGATMTDWTGISCIESAFSTSMPSNDLTCGGNPLYLRRRGVAHSRPERGGLKGQSPN